MSQRNEPAVNLGLILRVKLSTLRHSRPPGSWGAFLRPSSLRTGREPLGSSLEHLVAMSLVYLCSTWLAPGVSGGGSLGFRVVFSLEGDDSPRVWAADCCPRRASREIPKSPGGFLPFTGPHRLSAFAQAGRLVILDLQCRDFADPQADIQHQGHQRLIPHRTVAHSQRHAKSQRA